MVFKSPISRIFGASPVKPLQTHIDRVLQCVSKLEPLFQASFEEDWDTVISLRNEIIDLEHQADTLKKDIRLQLPKGLFLPVSRRDLLNMLSMQDKIANKSKDIAGLIFCRKMVIPEHLQAAFLKFIKRSIDACAQADKTVNELDELLATGFRGGEIDLVETMIHELDDIEHDTDDLQAELRQELMKIEKDLPPIDVMFLYELTDWIGDLGDLAQRVGSRLELMLAR